MMFSIQYISKCDIKHICVKAKLPLFQSTTCEDVVDMEVKIYRLDLSTTWNEWSAVCFDCFIPEKRAPGIKRLETGWNVVAKRRIPAPTRN